MLNWLKRAKNKDSQSVDKIIQEEIRANLGISAIELRQENDEGPLFSFKVESNGAAVFSGSEEKVSLIVAANGITMIKESDNNPVTERRTLSQEDLRKVPADAYDCVFVNMIANSGEIYSCLIVQPDTQIFGNMRAFWWSLAKQHIETVSGTLNRVSIYNLSSTNDDMGRKKFYAMYTRNSSAFGFPSVSAFSGTCLAKD
jgi:hypothetical protein